MVTQNVRASRTECDILVETLVVPSKKSIITPLEFQLIPSASNVYTHPNSGTSTNTSSSIRHHVPSTVLKFVQEVTSTLPGAQKMGQPIRDYYIDRKAPIIDFAINRSFASHCFNVGREHCRNEIMISIDVANGKVYQRCWDEDCRRSRYDMRIKSPEDVLTILVKMHPTYLSSKPGQSLQVEPCLSCVGKVPVSEENTGDCNSNNATSFKEIDRRLAHFDSRLINDIPIHLLALQSTHHYAETTHHHLLARLDSKYFEGLRSSQKLD